MRCAERRVARRCACQRSRPNARRALTSRDFAPLPALGVPGGCASDADAAFYDGPAEFRSGRRTRAAGGGAQC
ncbi:DUF3025 domain-containing protein [Burkholderia arboris]|nr:DUF3025 domain-containing protein [Burkholderia arboris]